MRAKWMETHTCRQDLPLRLHFDFKFIYDAARYLYYPVEVWEAKFQEVLHKQCKTCCYFDSKSFNCSKRSTKQTLVSPETPLHKYFHLN